MKPRFFSSLIINCFNVSINRVNEGDEVIISNCVSDGFLWLAEIGLVVDGKARTFDGGIC